MKNIYKIFGSLFVIFLLIGCDENFSDTNEFAKNVAPPSNVSASFDITQDNTGLVTITPIGEGAVSFVLDYGDGSPVSSSIKSGGSVQHTFKEGNHTIKVTATGLNNLTTTADVSLVVSFNAPENLQVTIENDTAENVQIEAIKLVGKLYRIESLIPTLILKLKHKNPDIRKSSILSLIQLNINEAINPLRDLLKIEQDKNVIAIIKLAIKKINN